MNNNVIPTITLLIQHKRDEVARLDLRQLKRDQLLLSLLEININNSLVNLGCARRRGRLIHRSNDEHKIDSVYELGLGLDQVSEDQMIAGLMRLHLLVVLRYCKLSLESQTWVVDVLDGHKTTDTHHLTIRGRRI